MEDQGPNPDANARPASVEIAGVAKLFRTKGVATADALFIPLVTSAKRALAMADEVAKSNPSLKNSVEVLARTYMAGMLLEDPSFVVSTNTATDEDRYVLNVGTGEFYSRTWINATHGKRTLLMQTETIGKMKEGLYEVRDMQEQTTLLKFSEQDAQRQNFFSAVLPERCLVEIIQREGPGGSEDEGGVSQSVQIVLNVQIGEANVTLWLQREVDDSPWEVYDGRTRVKLGSLPLKEMDCGKGLVDELTAFLKAGHREFLDALPVDSRRNSRAQTR